MEVNEIRMGGTGRMEVFAQKEPCVKALRKEGGQLVGENDESEN